MMQCALPNGLDVSNITFCFSPTQCARFIPARPRPTSRPTGSLVPVGLRRAQGRRRGTPTPARAVGRDGRTSPHNRLCLCLFHGIDTSKTEVTTPSEPLTKPYQPTRHIEILHVSMCRYLSNGHRQRRKKRWSPISNRLPSYAGRAARAYYFVDGLQTKGGFQCKIEHQHSDYYII